MLRSFPHISTVILSTAILLVAAPTAGRGVLSQEPATPPAAQTPTAQTPAPPPPPAVNNPVKATPESLAKAKRTYGFDCAMCHGANGNGKTDLAKDMQLTLSDWSDPKAFEGKTDGDLYQAIRSGKGKMPAEDASRAKDDDVWNLVTYVRNLAKKGAAASTPAP
jgi:mono/diheme cytochrome c family protein